MFYDPSTRWETLSKFQDRLMPQMMLLFFTEMLPASHFNIIYDFSLQLSAVNSISL